MVAGRARRAKGRRECVCARSAYRVGHDESYCRECKDSTNRSFRREPSMVRKTAGRTSPLGAGMARGTYSIFGWFLATMCLLVACCFSAAHYTVVHMGEERRQERENLESWSTPAPARAGALCACCASVLGGERASAVLLARALSPSQARALAEVLDAAAQVAPGKMPTDPAPSREGSGGGKQQKVLGEHVLVKHEGGEDVELVYQTPERALGELI